MTDYVKNGNAQAVAASTTDQAVTGPIRPRNRMQALVTVVLSAAVKATGITLKLKDSYDGGVNYFDVGTESQTTVVAKAVDSATDVDATTDEITSTGHGFLTGDPLIYNKSTTEIDGLTDGSTYYGIKVDADTFQLAASLDDALAGTAIDLVDEGTGTDQTFVKAAYEIRMVSEDATDLAQLPLQEFVKVCVTTGSGDSATVSHVYWAEN